MALDFILRNNFRPNVGLRPQARKIGVLITDGKSQDDIVFNSQNLRDNNIELYAIGESLSVKHFLLRLLANCTIRLMGYMYLERLSGQRTSSCSLLFNLKVGLLAYKLGSSLCRDLPDAA